MSRVETSLVLCLLLGVLVKAQYQVPDVLVEPLSPKGFRVSIPDEEGISLFAFHGKINEEMHGREAGRYSVDILKPKDGRWVFQDRGARLKAGDIIYYWVNVDYDDGNGKRGYIKDDQMFTVSKLIPDNTTTTTTTTTRRPPPPPPTPTRIPFGTTTRKPITWDTTSTESQVCKPTSTMVNGKASCKDELIFEEHFSNLAENEWLPEIKFAGDPDYEFVVYQNNIDNLYLENDALHIRPTLMDDKRGHEFVLYSDGLDLGEQCTGIPQTFECVQTPKAWHILPPVISSQISTKYHLSFLYGVVEIRARLPKGDWLYPELYLRSRSDAYGPGLDSGIIRIAFTPGNADSRKALTGGCVLGQSVSARNYGIKTIRSEKDWTNEYHVFKVDWKPDSITVSVDEQIYGNIYPPEDGFAAEQTLLEIQSDTAERWRKGTRLAPFDQEMYVSLGVGVGGQCFSDRADGTKPWVNDDPKAQLNFYRNQDTWNKTWSADSELLVDYVKIWAL